MEVTRCSLPFHRCERMNRGGRLTAPRLFSWLYGSTTPRKSTCSLHREAVRKRLFRPTQTLGLRTQVTIGKQTQPGRPTENPSFSEKLTKPAMARFIAWI